MTDESISGDELNQLAARADSVPERLLSAARDAFGLREFGARVAELVRDSAFDLAAAAVRRAGSRMLSFESGDVAVGVRDHRARVPA